MNKRGFTLIEVVVVLAVVAILAAILTPTIVKNINDAKVTRATNETKVIGAAMASFYKDTGRWPTKQNAVSTANYYYLLYGDGNAAGGASNFNSTAGWTALSDTFANHLARNTPGGAAVAANQYTVLGKLKWNGPYIKEVTPDPWGTHYSCNIVSFWLNATYRDYAIYIVSPGADMLFTTGFDQSISSATAPVLGGDDIGFRIQ